MELSPYLDTVRSGVTSAASLGDDYTRQVAERLSSAVESSTRLALLEALADAAAVISADLAPSSVELRMAGPDPEFVVTVSAAEGEPRVLQPDPHPVEPEPFDPEPAGTDLDDEPTSRITLRLPQSVKARVDEMAEADQISTNAWLIRAVMDALAGRSSEARWPQPPQPPQPPRPPGGGSFFGPNGPFGPHGVFGPHGPFGGGEAQDPGRQEAGAPRTRGSVQGWVR